MNTPVIQVQNLTKFYRKQHPAVKGLDFTVPEGAVYGLLGPNGAGKTTTIQILMNLIKATEGQAEVLGIDCRNLKPNDFKSIGYVSENQRFPETMTLAGLCDYLAPFYSTWDKEYERNLCEQLELPRDVPFKHLSRGMKMKAALCAAMAFRPRLMVLDEPFSGLDPVIREEFSSAILALVSDNNCSVLLSSHDVEEVQRLCDWIGIMKPGKMEFSEPLEQLQERHRKIRVTFPEDFPPSPDWENSVEVTGRENGILEILHRNYQGEESLTQLQARLPKDSVVDVETMSLREIYLSIHRKSRSTL